MHSAKLIDYAPYNKEVIYTQFWPDSFAISKRI